MTIDPTSETSWGPGKKLASRFLCLYLLLYVFPFPFSWVPVVRQHIPDPWNPALPWIGEHLLGMGPVVVQPTGSGDTSYDYVKLFVFPLLALLGSLLWTAFDRRHRDDRPLLRWLVVGVRYYLGTLLLFYGMAKLFKTQFPFPTLERLSAPLGEASPMGLAWRFMGFSPGYNLFTGAGEALAGVLLFWRRTTTLGALVAIAVMANVVAMNFFYDIPVKLFSTHLLLMACGLAALDGRRLAAVLLLNRKAEPAVYPSHFSSPRARLAARIFKVAFLTMVLVNGIYGQLQAQKRWGDRRPKPPLYGLYVIEELDIGTDGTPAADAGAGTADESEAEAANAEADPAGVTDAKTAAEIEHWLHLILELPEQASIRLTDGRMLYLQAAVDAEARTLTLTTRGENPVATTWAYREPDLDTLELQADLEGRPHRIRMQRKTPEDYPLATRGFHWIQELPFHR